MAMATFESQYVGSTKWFDTATGIDSDGDEDFYNTQDGNLREDEGFVAYERIALLGFWRWFLSNVALCSAVVDCYGKCEEVGNARNLFYEMPKRDVLAWTNIVLWYAKWGDNKYGQDNSINRASFI
nr:pentatricopeptide repeat-containing protein At2g21090 [Tanacetum cinerariifolium]